MNKDYVLKVLGIVAIIAVVFFALSNSQSKTIRELREEYEEKLSSLEYSARYDDESYWSGYEEAQDNVRDWFDEEYGYYQEIYSDGFHHGYDQGYTAGIDHAIETADDWYEGAD